MDGVSALTGARSKIAFRLRCADPKRRVVCDTLLFLAGSGRRFRKLVAHLDCECDVVLPDPAGLKLNPSTLRRTGSLDSGPRQCNTAKRPIPLKDYAQLM